MRHSQETKDKAARMRADNVPETQIAAAVGASRTTLRTWHDPAYREKRKAADTERYKEPPRKVQRDKLKDRKRKQAKYWADVEASQNESEISPTPGEIRGDNLDSKSFIEEKPS